MLKRKNKFFSLSKNDFVCGVDIKSCVAEKTANFILHSIVKFSNSYVFGKLKALRGGKLSRVTAQQSQSTCTPDDFRFMHNRRLDPGRQSLL